MMTTTHRLTALNSIEQGIIRDMTDRPNFTISRSQLLNRILDYCDHPDTDTDDITAIYSTARMLDLPIRD